MFWSKKQQDAFLESLKPTVEREAAYQAKRYKQSRDDVANDINVWALEKMQQGKILPTDAETFIARQESGEGYEVREAARNAARKQARRVSKQSVALSDIDEPKMPEDVGRKMAETLGEFLDELDKSYSILAPKEREVLTNEVERHLGVSEKTARTQGARAALARARKKVGESPSPMLARFLASVLLVCGLLGGNLTASERQSVSAHQSMSCLHSVMEQHQAMVSQAAEIEHQCLAALPIHQ
jgi:DNA-directed RNA polymerase specialized sigma24 family protein